jgi:hypothetical protein
MFTSAVRLCLLAVLCALSACEKKPVELSVDRFGRTMDPGPLREAVTLQEVSFMVRTNEPETAVLGQVERRGLAEPIDDAAAAKLTAQGAPARLLDQLRESPHVLTPAERALYASREEKRKLAAEAARNSQDEVVRAKRVELDNSIHASERGRIITRLKQENAKVQELEQKLRLERYSTNKLSPYQGVARELSQARAQVTQSNEQLQALGTSPPQAGR